MKFNKIQRTVKWEFGYWGKTIKNWYSQGLPLKNFPKLPSNISTMQSSIYTLAWNYEWEKSNNDGKKSLKEYKFKLPDGIPVTGGGLYWPSQGFALDNDVCDYFDFDKSQVLVDVDQLFYPHFKRQVLSEEINSIIYIDLDGVKRKYLRKESTIPTALDWPIKDWSSWNKIKEERLNLNNIRERFPKNWKEFIKKYKNRDYPLAVGGYPIGFFGILAHLMGYENLFYSYYDKPDLLKDILDTFTNLWISIWEEVLSMVDIDFVQMWEDVSTNKASMISPSLFKEFMTPYYKKVTNFFKGKGVYTILVDTDGDCSELVPLFLEAGVTGLYPMETSTGMNIFLVRKNYPNLQILGGIPKGDILFGKRKIDEILEPIKGLLKQGGYIPFADHLIPPEIPWEYFKYYRESLNDIIENN